MTKLAYFIPAGAAEPRWADAGHTAITLNIMFPHLGATGPFTAREEDPAAPHGEEIFARALAGEFGPIAEYVAPQPAVPAAVSRRQFFHALAVLGHISQAEARAAVKTRDLPAAFETALQSLPPVEQFNALMLLEGAEEFERGHSLTETMAALLGWAPSQVNELFTAAAAL